MIVKYVEDIFAIVIQKNLDTILTTFNNYHNKLQFTMEIEKHNTIPYLDIKIIKKKNQIITNWYAKPTSSGRIMNYFSSQPKNQKINTAHNLINRALDNSHEKFQKENILKIKTILYENNYPKNLTNTLIKKKLYKITKESETNVNEEKDKQKHFSIKYIAGLTNKQITTNNNMIPAYKANKTLNTIFTNTKSTINKLQQNNVVYEIKCLGNNEQQCEKVYIGTTKRSLETRIKEHETDISKEKESTGLSQHTKQYGHTADLYGVRILDKEK